MAIVSIILVGLFFKISSSYIKNFGNLYVAFGNVSFGTGYSLDKVSSDLENNKAGFVVYSNYGVEKFMHYRNLGIADWSVISVIEKDIITAKTTHLTKQLFILAIGVMVIFPLLLIFAVSSMETSKINKQAAQAKTAFLANMSHEIRTPMNSIVGIGEILLREDIPNNQKNYVMSIVNAGNGLLTIQPLPFIEVLIVDDNEVNLQIAKGLVTPYHTNVDCALSGEKVMKYFLKCQKT